MVAATDMPRNLGDIPRQQAALRGNEIAAHFEGRDTTFAQFNIYSSQVANGLLSLNLKPQSRICYLGKNSDLFFELLYGAIKSRIVVAPVNWRLATPEIAYIVNDCKAEVLFVGPEFVAVIPALKEAVPSLRTIILMEGAHGDPQDFETWRDAQSQIDGHWPVGWEDVAVQLYTSGTTGHPKGAMLPHRSFLDLRDEKYGERPAWNIWTSEDVSLIAMPCFHIGGTAWQILTMYSGAKGIIAREFDPRSVLDNFERFGVSKLFLVPAAMQFIVRHPRARSVDYSRLKYMLYGASPIPLDLLKECMEVFGCGFVQMYGMTETCGTIVALPPEDHSLEGTPRMRAAGKAMPGVEIAVVDEAGNPVPTGTVGEITSRSGANMSGYWNLPEATTKTMTADGWLRTGDAGYMDEDGYLYIHDRVKDMIISGGENIYPAEVENAVFGHPAIAEVAVIGVPDDKWGEAVKAMVVRKEGMDVTPDEIIEWTRKRIAGFKTPKSIEFIDVLPRNASGKILRRQLREPFWVGKERHVN